MHFEHDEGAEIGYVVTTHGESLGMPGSVAKTIYAGYGVVIDLDEDGNVLGVEVFDE